MVSPKRDGIHGAGGGDDSDCQAASSVSGIRADTRSIQAQVCAFVRIVSGPHKGVALNSTAFDSTPPIQSCTICTANYAHAKNEFRRPVKRIL